MESNTRYTVLHEGTTWSERETIKGKMCWSCCPFWLIWRTFTKHECLENNIINQADLFGGVLWKTNMSFISICSLLPATFPVILSVFVHHSTLPNASPSPESWSLSNMFTFLILLHFNVCIKFRAKFKDCTRCCLGHTVIKKVLDSFVLVPLEKKGGKVLQLIQQPKPNLAT